MQEFESLLCEHKDALERFVKFKVQNPYDAEDILQETCLAACRNYDTLKNKAVFKAWLLGIARYCSFSCKARGIAGNVYCS